MPLLKSKVFDALIYNKPFFYQPIKSKQEVYKKLVEMSRNNDYTTGILSHYLDHQNYNKLIVIDYQIRLFLNK